MELQIPYSIRSKVQKESILWREKDRNKGNNTNIVPMERGGNNRGRNMSGSYPSVGEHTAQNERFGIYGIFERKKQSNDIPKIWKYEIRVSKPRILV